jgi:hypothetical protein
MVYVASGPATGALDPGFAAAGLPLPSWEELEEDGSSLEGLTYVDLPTNHWPMWSRPQELAAVISDVAQGASGA